MLSPSAWVALVFLSVLQVVLGIDNIVLLTILSRTLKVQERKRARRWGVIVAMISRLMLLGCISYLAGLSAPLGTILGHTITVKGLVLGLGGLFLMTKGAQEIYQDVEHPHGKPEHGQQKAAATFGAVLVQIFLLDIIFSIDQVIAAVGMEDVLMVQVLSVLLSVVAMLFFVEKLALILERHPSVRLLALSFLIVIGVSLCGQMVGVAVPENIIYFGMAYAVAVEVLNIRRRKHVGVTSPPLQRESPLEPELHREEQHIPKQD